MTSYLRMLRRRSSPRRRPSTRPVLLELEARALPTVLHPLSVVLPRLNDSSSVPGYTPDQIRQAYGLDRLLFNGAIPADGWRQTIGIVTAYDNPNLAADLTAFDSYFGIADPPALTVVGQDGSSKLPKPDAGWASETALDVEWAHAIAPGAALRVVEANSADENDLYAAADTAAADPNVNVVSMSFGGPESVFETTADGYFLPPNTSHAVTFVAAAGDNGTVTYPAASPNVIGVGGTTLTLDANGYRDTETAWSSTGGGPSQYEPVPSFQANVMSPPLTHRGTPDVAYNADPSTGYAVYDSFGSSGSPWLSMGGTSAGAPQWAALLAVADQGRSVWGKAPLRGTSQTLALLYGDPGAFYDVTQGGNGNYQAGPGYDLVSGLGSPNGYQLVNDLVTANPQGSSPSPSKPPPWTYPTGPTGTTLGNGTGTPVSGATPAGTSGSPGNPSPGTTPPPTPTPVGPVATLDGGTNPGGSGSTSPTTGGGGGTVGGSTSTPVNPAPGSPAPQAPSGPEAVTDTIGTDAPSVPGAGSIEPIPFVLIDPFGPHVHHHRAVHIPPHHRAHDGAPTLHAHPRHRS
jgi:hypothetical protein